MGNRGLHVGEVGHVADDRCRARASEALDDLAQRGDVALHREDPVDDDQDAAAVGLGALQHLLELVEAVVTERAQLRA